MYDQAFNLRALIMESALARRDRNRRPDTWWLTAGKGGVGTSTVAVNLAAVLARKGKNVLVATTSEQPHDLEWLCGLDESGPGTGVSLRQGPAGMLLLSAGTGSAGTTVQQVCEALDNFYGCVDLVVVDAGPRFCAVDPAWGSGDTLLYVTTADEMAVLDTYAAIKQLVTQTASPGPRMGILINQTEGVRQGGYVFERIAETAQRFLGIQVSLMGEVPYEPTMSPARPSQLPIVLQSPTSAMARAIERVAAAVIRQGESS